MTVYGEFCLHGFSCSYCIYGLLPDIAISISSDTLERVGEREGVD